MEPYTIERELPFWRVHTWDRTVDGPRTYRLDRMRSAKLMTERFEPRDGFDPNYLAEPATARLWHAPPIARWKLERGARALTDRSAIADVTFKTEEWLLSEVLADRGETVVVEPRRCVGRSRHARSQLVAELGLSPSPEARGKQSLKRAPRPGAGGLQRPSVRHGDRSREPEADPGRADTARARGERVEHRVELSVEPGAVVRHVDDDDGRPPPPPRSRRSSRAGDRCRRG